MPIALDDPAIVHLTIVQGAYNDHGYAWVRNGSRQSLAGFRPEAEIRTTDGRDKLIANLAPYMRIDTTTNVVHLEIPADAAKLIDRNGRWDLYLVHETDPAATVRLLGGRVTVDGSVSRRG